MASNNHGDVRYFEDVAVGMELPPLTKQIDLVRMMAYGAATWDFIRVHYDADYVRERGFPGPFVDGQMMGGFLAQQVQEWAGPTAFLCKLSFRNRIMVYPGDSLVCHGLVTGAYLSEVPEEDSPLPNNTGLVECDLWIENQKGERVVHPAQAQVRFPLRGSKTGS